ncbi:glycosyl hydrolase [Aquisphaera insulae]|uniref:glycosyl hydrolase n=1 Tax=Aquisphaera insulae TaxID=2712864 RepID=UPI0013EB5D3B|nr:glycosyl hydrolase [Aquisphaera insulae]
MIRSCPPALLSIPILLASVASAVGEDRPRLEDRFARPPADARIFKIVHGWPDEPARQDELMGRLQAQGFGGVVSNVSFDGYLESPSHWGSFERAVREAGRRGFAQWLYDERGYPSGNAGGIVLRDHPEWQASGLLVAGADATDRPLAVSLPPGRLVLAAAFPLRHGAIDLGGKVDLADRARSGRLEWQPPATGGPWRVLLITESRLYEGTHADSNVWEKRPYVDLLAPEVTRYFLDVTHARYAGRLGKDLGRLFIATFTDEPSLMSVFMRPMPYAVLPWSPRLPEVFRSRRGYPLESILPSLASDSGPSAAKARHDYWLTVAELVSDGYFGQIRDWCRSHSLLSGGHLLMEESLAAHVPLYGDFLRCARKLDAPGIDCLTSLPPEVPWFVARLAASAAELEGNTLVMSETSDHSQRYRPAGDARPVRPVSESEIRGTLNRLLAGGVNCITSYYSFEGLPDDAVRRLNDWLGRVAAVLRGTHPAADVAVVYPIESTWVRFTPSREWTRDCAAANSVDALFRNAMELLFQSRREFLVADSRALIEAKVVDGTLRHRDQAWRVVVLPGADTLPLAAWENLSRFAREGGVLIALGGLPENSEAEFPSARVQAIAREVFGEAAPGPTANANARGGGGIHLPAGTEFLLPVALRGVVESDLVVAGDAANLRLTHRRGDSQDWYFLINDSPRPWAGELSLPASAGGITTWDPADGKIRAATDGSRIPISLESYGATLLRTSATLPGARKPMTSGTLPSLTLTPLNPGEPTVGHGEFVRADLRPMGASAAGGPSRYAARGRLTKGGVDVHLFVQFRFDGPRSLSPTDCLVLDVTVPPGQAAATELLVFLHEADGGDFLASAGRSLATPGRIRSIIPVSRFQRFEGAKDGDGILDLSRIGAVSVGWGGYKGAEGEAIEFEVEPPLRGEVR